MKAWLMFLLAIASVCACQTATSNSEKYEEAAQAADVSGIPSPPPPETDKAKRTLLDSTDAAADTGDGLSVLQSGNRPPSLMVNRQMIRTANLSIECKDYAAFVGRVNAVIQSNNGWIDSEQETHSDYQRQNVLQIKVPVQYFDKLVQGLAGLDGKLIEKKINSEDVTNAIVDTKGRIEAKKLIRARYFELLKQAKNMEDMLEVQREINSITEDMESAAYNVQNMQSQAAYSTIYLTYLQPLNSAPTLDNPGFGLRLWEAMQGGIEGVKGIIIVLAALWPLWLILGVLMVWWRRRRPATKLPDTKTATV